jgi:peptide/nickel transport system permease protein
MNINDSKETIKNKYIEQKLYGRKGFLKTAKTGKGKWIRFWVLLIVAAAVVFTAMFGHLFAPYYPLETDFASALSAPGAGHICGTDNLGRDVFSRILCGAGNSFALTFLCIAIISILGMILGALSGYFGGIIDTFIMRVTDVLLAFPDSVFAIAVVGVLGPGLLNTILALSVIWWTKYARVTRGLVSQMRSKDYITEARFGGAGTFKIIYKYMIPNILPQIIIMATVDIGGMMLTLAGLSFLGLSTQPPAPEWGYMLYEGKSYLQTAPWVMIFAGLAIFITVIVFNLLGDSMRDILDPKE